VRAVHAEFFNQAGQVVKETVIAEAKVGGGRDNLNVGSQNDRLDGGAGNDTINAAYGYSIR
jgi:Ca2+-binding RTX toxin-like protein